MGWGLCINTGYINVNMILPCSQGLRVVLIVFIVFNIQINLSTSSLSLSAPCTSFYFLCFLLVILILCQQTLFLSLSFFPHFLSPSLSPGNAMEQSDGDASRGAVVFLAVWWQPVPSSVLLDSHWSCLAAACLFSGLAGPAQPASPHDDHWLTYSTTCLVLSDWLTSAP